MAETGDFRVRETTKYNEYYAIAAMRVSESIKSQRVRKYHCCFAQSKSYLQNNTEIKLPHCVLSDAVENSWRLHFLGWITLSKMEIRMEKSFQRATVDRVTKFARKTCDIRFWHALTFAFALNFSAIHFETCQASNWWDVSWCSLSMTLQIDLCPSVAILFTTTPSSWSSWKHFWKPSFSMAFDDVTSVTWTIWNVTTFPSSFIIVDVPYLALWPGLSHRPSPTKLMGPSALEITRISLLAFAQALCTTGKRNLFWMR